MNCKNALPTPVEKELFGGSFSTGMDKAFAFTKIKKTSRQAVSMGITRRVMHMVTALSRTIKNLLDLYLL